MKAPLKYLLIVALLQFLSLSISAATMEDLDESFSFAQPSYVDPKEVVKLLFEPYVGTINFMEGGHNLKKAISILNRIPIKEQFDFIEQMQGLLKPGMSLSSCVNILEGLEGLRFKGESATPMQRYTLIKQAKKFLPEDMEVNAWADFFCAMQRISEANREMFVTQGLYLALDLFRTEDRRPILFGLKRIQEDEIEELVGTILADLHIFMNGGSISRSSKYAEFILGAVPDNTIKCYKVWNEKK